MRRRGRPTALAGTAVVVASLAGLAGCVGTGHYQPRDPGPTRVATPARTRTFTHKRVRHTAGQPPLRALVTAQTQDRLLVVDLPSGRVVRHISVPGDPEYVATIGSGGPVLVVSSAAGTVTVLGGSSLHVMKVLRGFGAPHIPAIAPGGRYAYVTDDARGQVDVIRLTNDKVVSRTFVGVGAHHLAFSPNGQQVWVALGQSASTIAILSDVVSRPSSPSSVRVNPGHPRPIGQFHPGYLAHDLMFTPNGRQVWITSANGPDVGVFSAGARRLLFRVPAGQPPQHVVFDGRYAYVTSGYGSRIEQVLLASGRVVKRAAAPYGSFDLDAGGGYVVTSSLLRGTLAIYNTQLHLLRVRRVAPSAEDVTIFRP
jgi:DNA-binding beta-propeller fold protein YncE